MRKVENTWVSVFLGVRARRGERYRWKGRDNGRAREGRWRREEEMK